MFDNVTPVAPALSYIVPYFVRKQKQKHRPDGFSELTPDRCGDILKIYYLSGELFENMEGTA